MLLPNGPCREGFVTTFIHTFEWLLACVGQVVFIQVALLFVSLIASFIGALERSLAGMTALVRFQRGPTGEFLPAVLNRARVGFFRFLP